MLCQLLLVNFRRLSYSPSSTSTKHIIGCIKLPSTFIGCRLKSTSENQSNAVSSPKENENVPTTIVEKVKQNTKDAGYLTIIIAGIGVTGLMFYAIFRELFSRQSPNSIYSDALKLCRNDTSICDALGKPIKGYGELSSRGRRRRVSHFEYEKDGKNFMRLKFYIEGTRNTGTVHLEMEQDEKSKFQYRYLFVDIEGYPPRTIVLKDNRHLSKNYDNPPLNTLKY